jgi:hypothetical protein
MMQLFNHSINNTDLIAKLVDGAAQLLAPDRQHVAVLLELAEVPWKKIIRWVENPFNYLIG